ncbi:uncharacterized protein LOC141634013 [Silene latifolia]|uniref:uncharacterized protein LOC141634013 n=1 Tax=Silene latifolia TaxID=37657 RepID=UPI003D7845C9
MSTLIETTPEGPKIATLLEWNSRNKEFLTGLQARLNRARDPNASSDVVTLSVLKTKKAKHILQDESYHLNVIIPLAEFQKINAYVGCSYCGKRSDYAACEHFKCETCTKDGVVAEPRFMRK